MTQTADILDDIIDEALAFQLAKARYESMFNMFSARVPALSPEHFWPMADVFRQVVLQTMVYRRESIASLAAHEFLRLAAIGESPWSVSAAVHFCLSYRHYTRLAYAGGDKCSFGFDRGDDGYGDLMDAVVLLGREFNERLHAARFCDLSEFHQAVRDQCDASVSVDEFPFPYATDPVRSRDSLAKRLCDMVRRGENYFSMSLEEEAAERVAVEARRRNRGREERCDAR